MADNKLRKTDNGLENVNERPAVAPHVDVYENEKELLLVVDMPGVQKDALAVHLDAESLTLEGRRDGSPEGSTLVTEYRPYDFRRTFKVPPGVDRAKIAAELSAGVLRLHLPKEAAAQPRRIPIRAN